MEEEGDDDYGDIYADVEVQATSAINVTPQTQNPDKACVDFDEDDEDDDDLDIVLNTDDDNNNNTSLRNRELEDEDDYNNNNNSPSLYKYVRSQSAAYGSDLRGMGCMASAYLSRFSLPRARNILDVNIDIFEQKPWRHPGADTTDYFNYGFNEESWKVYCNQVDEYRHRGPVSRGTLPSEAPQLTEVDMVQGQAIQVEENIFERQSSMDIWGQLDRDSDFIEIKLDPEGTSAPEESNHEDVSGDDTTDHLSFSSASEDESIEGNYVEMDIYSPKTRGVSENQEIQQVLTIEKTRTSNYTKEANLVAETSDAGKRHAYHSESFDDDACIDRRKSYTHDRCLTELTRSVKPEYRHSEDSDKSNEKRGPAEDRYHERRLGDNIKLDDQTYYERRLGDNRKLDDHTYYERKLGDNTKLDDHTYYERRLGDNTKLDDHTYYERRLGDNTYHERGSYPVYKYRTHKDFNLKTHRESDYIISRRTDDYRKSGEHRYDVRDRSDFFPMSDELPSTFHQRLHAFDPYNEENISYSKSEVTSDYYGERFCGYEDWDTDRSKANIDQTVFRSSEEYAYYDEQRRYFEDDRMMAGSWSHNEKGRHKEANLYSRNKREVDEFYVEPRYYDDIHGESFRSSTYNDRNRDDVEYTRWDFKGPGRKRKRSCSLLSELDNPLLKRDNEQSFASRSPEESHIRWHGNTTPKTSFHKGHGSYGGQYSKLFDREDRNIDIDDHVNMRRKQCHWQSEIQCEHEIKFRHEDSELCAHRNSYSFDEVSRHKRFVSEHDPYYDELIEDPYVVDSQLVEGSVYAMELTDVQHANDRRYYKHKNEVFSGSKCIKTNGMSHERLPLSSRKSHLGARKVKSSAKHKKPKWMNLDTSINDKVAIADKVKASDEGLDIEEGQILTEETKVAPTRHKTPGHINRSSNQNEKSEFDNTRILEAMVKMEKRRTRFNEPIMINNNSTYNSIKLTVPGSAQETTSSKQQRPARKRRWGGS